MPQETTEDILRKSLNAVDQNRRRLTWLLAIAGLTVVWEFYHLLAQVEPTGDVPRMIVAAVMVLCFWTLGLTVLLVFQLATVARRILRAIELASKPD
jgi:hypothetical protein